MSLNITCSCLKLPRRLDLATSEWSGACLIDLTCVRKSVLSLRVRIGILIAFFFYYWCYALFPGLRGIGRFMADLRRVLMGMAWCCVTDKARIRDGLWHTPRYPPPPLSLFILPLNRGRRETRKWKQMSAKFEKEGFLWFLFPFKSILMIMTFW